jgi:hypothetical protein
VLPDAVYFDHRPVVCELQEAESPPTGGATGGPEE